MAETPIEQQYRQSPSRWIPREPTDRPGRRGFEAGRSDGGMIPMMPAGGSAPVDPNAPATQGDLQSQINASIEAAMGGGPGDIIGGDGAWDGGRGSWYGPPGQAGTQFMPAPPEPYTDGMENVLLRSMPAEVRARLQEVLVATGMASSVVPGEMDDGTVAGFRRLLSVSNRNGERWQSTMYRLQRAAARGDFDPDPEDRDPFRFVEAEYLPPDPAEVRNSIRDLATKIVPDVEISDEEIEYLRDQFEGMGAQQFRASEQQRMNDARAEFAANDPTATGDEVITTSEGVQEVSAAERFREFFEDRYSANIQRGEDVEQESARRDMTQDNLGRLLQIATGA